MTFLVINSVSLPTWQFREMSSFGNDSHMIFKVEKVAQKRKFGKSRVTTRSIFCQRNMIDQRKTTMTLICIGVLHTALLYQAVIYVQKSHILSILNYRKTSKVLFSYRPNLG